MKTDKQVQKDVIAELNWEPSVNATHIGVEVSDGVVTLAGQVDSYAEKIGAESAAQRVTGVKAIAVETVSLVSGSVTVKVSLAVRPALVSAIVTDALSPACTRISGTSLAPVTVTVAVEVAVPPWPSLIE